MRAVFDWHPLPGGPYPLGPFQLQARMLPHFVPNAGVRLQAQALTVAYTGDTGPDPLLAELGHQACTSSKPVTAASNPPMPPLQPARNRCT